VAGNINTGYGASNQPITVSLASLANSGQRQSTAIDATANKPKDALVFVSVKTAGVQAAPNLVNVYAYASADGGTSYSDSSTGTDGAITLTSPPNMVLLGSINAPITATTYKGGPWSVAEKFGGSMPAKWGVVFENKTGAALDGTEGSHAKFYQEVYETY
jgi:hypothetical protein